mmetsp:Transcript_32939/g.76949  ORF Transcript_32939/g.76949 Transcript_32939/m.76949 type:complete len:206 (-) Transcript_32939:35-652(-)
MRSMRNSSTLSRYLRVSISTFPEAGIDARWEKKEERSVGRKSGVEAAPSFFCFFTMLFHFFSSCGACRISSSRRAREMCSQRGSATCWRQTPRTMAFSSDWKQLTRNFTIIPFSRTDASSLSWAATTAAKNAGNTSARVSNACHAFTCSRNFSLTMMMRESTCGSVAGSAAPSAGKCGQRYFSRNWEYSSVMMRFSANPDPDILS